MKRFLRNRTKRAKMQTSLQKRGSGTLHLDTAFEERTYADMEKLEGGKKNPDFNEDEMPVEGFYSGSSAVEDIRAQIEKGQTDYSEDIYGAHIETFFSYFANEGFAMQENATKGGSEQEAKFVFTETSFVGRKNDGTSTLVELPAKKDDKKSRNKAEQRRLKKEGLKKMDVKSFPKKGKGKGNKIIKNNAKNSQTYSWRELSLPIDFEDYDRHEKGNGFVSNGPTQNLTKEKGISSEKNTETYKPHVQIIGGSINRKISLPGLSSVKSSRTSYDHFQDFANGRKLSGITDDESVSEINSELGINVALSERTGKYDDVIAELSTKSQVAKTRNNSGVSINSRCQCSQQLDRQPTSSRDVENSKYNAGFNMDANEQSIVPSNSEIKTHKEEVCKHCQKYQRHYDRDYGEEGATKKNEVGHEDRYSTEKLSENSGYWTSKQAKVGFDGNDALVMDGDFDRLSIRMEASLTSESNTDVYTNASFVQPQAIVLAREDTLKTMHRVSQERGSNEHETGPERSSVINIEKWQQTYIRPSIRDIQRIGEQNLLKDASLSKEALTEDASKRDTSDSTRDTSQSIEPPVTNTCQCDQEENESNLSCEVHRSPRNMESRITRREKHEVIEETSLIKKTVEHTVQINSNRKREFVKEHYAFASMTQVKEILTKNTKVKEEWHLIPSMVQNDDRGIVSGALENGSVDCTSKDDIQEIVTTSFIADRPSSQQKTSPTRINVNDIELSVSGKKALPTLNSKQGDVESGIKSVSEETQRPVSRHSTHLEHLSQVLKDIGSKRQKVQANLPARLKSRKNRVQEKRQNGDVEIAEENKDTTDADVAKNRIKDVGNAEEPTVEPLDNTFLIQGAKEEEEKRKIDEERIKSFSNEARSTIDDLLKKNKLTKRQNMTLMLILSAIEAEMPFQFFETIEKSITFKLILKELIDQKQELIMYNVYQAEREMEIDNI